MTRVQLCGPLAVELDGVKVLPPGRQGRLLLAYLIVNRARACSRDELIELLWPEDPPADPGEALSALLSRLRRALGGDVLQGRRELRLVLGENAWVDLEAAARLEPSALEITSRGFMVGDDAPWIEERRREVAELRLRALEAVAGSAEPAAAERAARELVEAEPFRESGHRLLMRALADGGNVAEALRAYEDLRVRLREELGAVPGPEIQELHSALLTARPRPRRPDERKLVTVVCAEPADTLADPEDLRAAHARLREVFEGFGAVHDPPLAVFGVPATREDDPERAVRAALRACELGLAARAGIATGEAIVSGGAATGSVTTTAEQLHRAAVRGTALADEATVHAARGALDFEPVGPGWAAHDAPAPRRPAPRPLVGRGYELAALEALYARVVAERRPHLVTVVGHAGIGKSRLVDEFGADHRGRCLPYGEGITYWALREILTGAAGIVLGDSAAEAAAKLRALVEERVGDEVERLTSALAASAGLVLPGPEREEVSPGSVADEIALAWPRLLSALAPAVVVIEDLHWAEPPLLDLVEAIVGRCEGPLLLVATARPELAEARPGWGYRPGMSQVVLPPLNDAETQALVDGLLPARDAALRQRVARTAEGNAFFAEELARHLSSDVAGEIPNTVRALLAARIDALPAIERRVLRHASVVGRTFWPPALEADVEPGPPLRALEARGFVVARAASTLPGHTEFGFVHGLTREVAYHSIPRADRCRTHAAVARWIEDRVGDRREEFVELLAHHYEAALAWPDALTDREAIRAAALRALVDAGDAARRRMAIDQAVRFADRALALATTDAERLGAVELKARSFHAAMRGDDALAAYTEGIELAKRVGDRAAATRMRGFAILFCTRYAGALKRPGWPETATALVQEGLEVDGVELPSFTAGALLLGRCWGVRRWSTPRLSRSGDIADARRAVEIAEEIRSSFLLAVALEGLTWLSFDAGHCGAAALGERHLQAASQLSDRVEAHESVTVAVMCFARAGDFTRARAVATEASQQALRLNPHRRLHAAAAEALARVPSGAFAELAEATAGVPELVAAEGQHVCATGVVGLAGHVLALSELHDPAAPAALALLEEIAPPDRPLGGWGHTIVEILRPVIGPEAACARLDTIGPASGDVARLRAEIPARALTGDSKLRALLDEAHALAGPACAADLAAIAEWGEAVVSRDRERARRAAAALDDFGEHYTAARLLADL